MRISIVITKHGRPIARVVPLESGYDETTLGSVHLVAEPDEAYYSTGEAWDADTGPD
jgi:antitoxin (DNA-binding transcriptional repressor) of toxin-antitoxin stability system